MIGSNERVSATLTFSCECGAVARVEAIRLGTQSDCLPAGSLRGTAMGLITTTFDALDFRDHTPEGWMASDPYTRCTYCPRCWKEIEDGVVEDRKARA